MSEQLWVYMGSSEGRGIIHRVISKTNKTITTWSVYDENDNCGGWTWSGPIEEFMKNFKKYEG